MNKIEAYIAGDYAGLEIKGNKFYYGYEKTKKEEWCFAVNGKIQYTETELQEHSEYELRNVEEFLLVGIGLWIQDNI